MRMRMHTSAVCDVFFLKCIKKPTFIAHSMMMEMYLLEVSFGWWDKNTTQRWIICLPKRPLIHIWMSRLKFGLRRKIGQLFSEMNLCDSIYLLFSACGVALLIEFPLYNSHEILLAKNKKTLPLYNSSKWSLLKTSMNL